MQDYYQEVQYIPLCNTDGTITGQGERWDVHKKGILHRGFTVVLSLKTCFVLQRRRHPVFDDVVDLTSSSHPLMIQGQMEDEREAVARCLSREWHLDIKDTSMIKKRGAIVYKAHDNAGYTEHEFCTFYDVKIDTLNPPDFAYAYGYEVVEKDYFSNHHDRFNLAPWVSVGIAHFK